MLRPRFNNGRSALDSYKGRRNRGDERDDSHKTERLGRSGRWRHRDQEHGKGDSNRGDDIKLHGSDGMIGDPNQARGREDADSADTADE